MASASEPHMDASRIVAAVGGPPQPSPSLPPSGLRTPCCVVADSVVGCRIVQFIDEVGEAAKDVAGLGEVTKAFPYKGPSAHVRLVAGARRDTVAGRSFGGPRVEGVDRVWGIYTILVAVRGKEWRRTRLPPTFPARQSTSLTMCCRQERIALGRQAAAGGQIEPPTVHGAGQEVSVDVGERHRSAPRWGHQRCTSRAPHCHTSKGARSSLLSRRLTPSAGFGAATVGVSAASA